MASLNKATIIGTLGRDPEVRYTSSGEAVATLSLATTSSWKDKNTGEKKEETEWHRVTMYGRLAEIAGEYAKKGRQLYIEGRLKTRKWKDKDGVEKYTTEIVADQMQLLGSRDDGQSAAPQAQAKPQQQRATQPQRASAMDGYDDSDIPF